MPVHTGLPGAFLVFGKDVGGQGDNRSSYPLVADFPRAQLLGGTLRSVVAPDGFTLEIEVPA